MFTGVWKPALLPTTRFVLAVVLLCHTTTLLANETNYDLTRIADGVFVIFGPTDLQTRENRGFRNNVGIVLTDKGVVIIDPGGSAWSGEMVVERISSISSEPIIAIFNTHAHDDHWMGNEGIKRNYPDAVIYAHPIAKRKIEGSDGERSLESVNQRTQGTGGNEKVVPPDKALDDNTIVSFGTTRFRIHHAGAAHTNNDLLVELIDQRVLFTGDIVRNGMIGLIDEEGSFKGNIAVIDKILDDDFSFYVPGHGPAGGMDVPELYRRYLNALVSTVEELFEEDLADFEMKPKVLEAVSEFANWKNFDALVGQHVSQVYLEVEADSF
jgi:glyoxylase-like metal-dependent hydrolase (beta-lactamase superfamily II)